MQFGGWSQYGGSTQFGGSSSRGLQYYRILKALRPPGAYVDDDDSIHACILRTCAVGLGDHLHVLADALAREIFPQLAGELLADWETYLRITPPATATIEDRRAAVLARWRGGYGVTLRDLRRLLAPLLAPTSALRDAFNGTAPGFRWTADPGAGAIAMAGGRLTLSLLAAAHGDWWVDGSGVALLEGPHLSIPLVDRDDDATLDLLVGTMTPDPHTAAGIALYEDEGNAWMLSMLRAATATRYVQLDVMAEGTLIRQVAQAVSPGALPAWLRLQREGELVKAYHGANLASLSLLSTQALGSLRPRELLIWARNTEGSLGAVSVGFNEVRLTHGQQENNVEIIETPLTAVPAADPAAIFRGFVRAPAGANLREAQRALDRAKLAHLVFHLGESDLFLCDDTASLCDRDVLGE